MLRARLPKPFCPQPAAPASRRCVPAVAAGMAILLYAFGVGAQSVDYRSYEELFGEPVTTSATGKPQRASDVAANMEIITADDIRRSGADNIPDILRFVAGIDVRRYGFAAADVGVRGYNETSNPRLLVLINGQQVYMDDLGRTQWYTLPVELEEIRQIEVVKGPNTALFGFNAASGVINIVTYDPMREPMNLVVARAGTQDYGALTAIGTGQIADIGGLRLSADGFRAHEYGAADVAPEDLPFREAPERAAFNANARMQIAPGTEMFASGSLVNTRIWEATASPYYGTDYERTNWSRVGLSSDTSMGLLGLDLYRNELLYQYQGSSEIEDLHDTVYVVQASDLMKLSATHTVRFGLDYRNNSATSSDVLAGRIGYQVYSASTMWDWQIAPDLSLTNAVRFDHFSLNQRGYLVPDVGFSAASYKDRTIDEPSFNSGLVWKLTDRDTLRLLAARGLQLPSIYDLGLQDREPPGPDGQSYLYLGNPAAQASSVLNVELDWDRSVPALASVLRAAVFAERTDNILTNPYEATAVGDGAFIDGVEELRAIAANVGHSSAAGAELELHGSSPLGLRWKASYSFISIVDSLSINQQGIFSPQDFQHNTPTHVIVLGGGYTRNAWELDVQGRWQSQFTDYRGDPTQVTLVPVKVDNYLVLDARVAYKIRPGLTLAVTAEQLNDDMILQSAGPPIDRRVFVTFTARF